MGKNIDLSKPLSDADRAWLEERGDLASIRVADAQAGADVGYEDLVSTDSQKAEAENRRITGEGAHAGTGESDSGAYNDMTKDELSGLLEARGLSKSGTKDELVQRLVESDNDAE